MEEAELVRQIGIGTIVMLTTIGLSGLCLWWVETRLRRYHGWLAREPHALKLVTLLIGTAVWMLGVVTFGVWLWALTFRALGLFPDLEQALYFSLVNFTTLGTGDVILPPGWRLLGGMAAANGFIIFGVLVASLNDALRQVRLSQMADVEARRR